MTFYILQSLPLMQNCYTFAIQTERSAKTYGESLRLFVENRNNTLKKY